MVMHGAPYQNPPLQTKCSATLRNDHADVGHRASYRDRPMCGTYQRPTSARPGLRSTLQRSCRCGAPGFEHTTKVPRLRFTPLGITTFLAIVVYFFPVGTGRVTSAKGHCDTCLGTKEIRQRGDRFVGNKNKRGQKN